MTQSATRRSNQLMTVENAMTGLTRCGRHEPHPATEQVEAQPYDRGHDDGDDLVREMT